MGRWPAFRLAADVGGLWQPDAGMVPAARGTRLMQRLGASYGATLRSQAPVTAVRDLGGSVEVATADGRFPVWIWMDDPSFYGFPVWPDRALKAAQDVGGRQVTATTRGFDPDPAASERLARFLRTHLPAAGTHDHTATCLYTLTPDRDLVLGPLPGHDRVLVALGAAHGFKFAPLLGRVLADLALHGGTDVDITSFAPNRPALTTSGVPANYLV
jgi:sarcosine oxidase